MAASWLYPYTLLLTLRTVCLVTRRHVSGDIMVISLCSTPHIEDCIPRDQAITLMAASWLYRYALLLTLRTVYLVTR